MNSHNRPDQLIDLSLRHSLKNWAAQQAPPAGGRDRLLKAVREDRSSPERKLFKFNFGWSFSFAFNQETINSQPLYSYALENVYSLKSNMAIL
jgi:hypothetical protein